MLGFHNITIHTTLIIFSHILPNQMTYFFFLTTFLKVNLIRE